MISFLISWYFLLVSIECHTAELVKNVHERLLLGHPENELLSDKTLQEKFPFLKSSCVRDALKLFLPICLKQGIESIDSSLKVETAVKLSICEFQVAGLGHIPESCQDSQTESMMDCMIQLESSTQWWTTYSGNYQRLSSICFENSLPYEKEQILSLFLNITSLHGELNENLTRHFYNLMSDVEFSSDQHLQNISQLFKDYLRQINEKFKDQRNEFEEYQEDIQGLMVQNSQVIKDQKNGFMQSIESLHHVINDIIVDLRNDEISHQRIVDIQNENLDGLGKIRNLMQEIYQFQKDDQTRMNQDMQLFFDNTRQNMELVSTEVEESHLRAVQALDVLPSMLDELIPKLFNAKEELLTDWKSITNMVNADFESWNHQINESFREISQRLNSTMQTIDDIDKSLSKFEKIFTKVSQIFSSLNILMRYSFSALYHFSTNKYVWKILLAGLLLRKVIFRLSWSRLMVPITAYVQLMIRCCLLIFVIYGGSKLGNTIMSVGI